MSLSFTHSSCCRKGRKLQRKESLASLLFPYLLPPMTHKVYRASINHKISVPTMTSFFLYGLLYHLCKSFFCNLRFLGRKNALCPENIIPLCVFIRILKRIFIPETMKKNIVKLVSWTTSHQICVIKTDHWSVIYTIKQIWSMDTKNIISL